MMRGIDYRARRKGICLVVDKPFPSERDKIQGLARVGRFGDECVRVKFEGVDLVDRIQHNLILAKVFAFRQERRRSPKAMESKAHSQKVVRRNNRVQAGSANVV